MNLMMRKFTKFMKNKNRGRHKRYTNVNQNPFSNYKCHGYGEMGHVKADCPKKNEENKGKFFLKKKKAYIAWEENDSSSSSSLSDLGEEAKICLMANNESMSSKVSNFNDPNQYYELHTTFQQLYTESEK